MLAVSFLRWATVAMVAFVAGPAFGADGYAPALYRWTGFYVGANLGGAWAHNDTTLTGVPGDFFLPRVGPPFFDTVAAFEAAGFAIGSPTFTGSGVIGGGQIGYNAQLSRNIILGIEADWQAQSLNDTVNGHMVTSSGISTRDVTTTSELHGLFTVRPRAGYAFDRMLVFVTGGLAIGERSVSESVNYSHANIVAGGSSGWSTGWTVGGGLEYALTRNWTLKGEYLHLDLGSMTAFLSNPKLAGGFISSITTSEDIVRGGINYKF
jgi:outer membrane immunogenic protein